VLMEQAQLSKVIRTNRNYSRKYEQALDWVGEPCDAPSAAIHHGSVLLANALSINPLHFYSLFIVRRIRVVGLIVRIIDVFILFLFLAFSLILLFA